MDPTSWRDENRQITYNKVLILNPNTELYTYNIPTFLQTLLHVELWMGINKKIQKKLSKIIEHLSWTFKIGRTFVKGRNFRQSEQLEQKKLQYGLFGKVKLVQKAEVRSGLRSGHRRLSFWAVTDMKQQYQKFFWKSILRKGQKRWGKWRVRGLSAVAHMGEAARAVPTQW